MKMLVLARLIYFVEVKLFISTFLVLNIIPEEIKEFIGIRNFKSNIFRVPANNSIMFGYFCIGFIDFMLAGKTLVNFTSMFSLHDFEKNDSIISKVKEIDKPNLTDQIKFRLNKLSKIENYFNRVNMLLLLIK